MQSGSHIFCKETNKTLLKFVEALCKALILKAGAFCGEVVPSRVYPCFRVRAIFEGWVPTENSGRAVYSHTAFLSVIGMGGLEMAVIWSSKIWTILPPKRSNKKANNRCLKYSTTYVLRELT